MKNKLKLDPNNPTSLPALRVALQDFFGEAQAFFGEMGKADAIPDAFRAQYTSLKDGVNNVLKQLSSVPTDQVPAAMEASYALNHMAYCLSSIKEMYENAVTGLNKMISELTPKAQLAQQLSGQIERDELLGGEKLTNRIKEAADKARTEERDRMIILGKRRQLLASANLPVPADDTVLEGEDKVFTDRQSTATNRLKKLGEVGIDTQALNAAHLATLVYGPEDGFNTQLAIHQATRGKRTSPADPPEPLAGGGKADQKDDKPFLMI